MTQSAVQMKYGAGFRFRLTYERLAHPRWTLYLSRHHKIIRLELHKHHTKHLLLLILQLNMSTMRSTLSLCHSAARLSRFQSSHRALSSNSRAFAQQDYGSGSGDPKGEKPGEQGKNPREDMEHPGPPAPDVGQKAGKGGSKGSSGNVQDGSAGM